ncbi:MAG TPA: CBS domain-containing protein [Nitrospira sp.]|nr:CBS domain-containing protein [Nitrospira sp.]
MTERSESRVSEYMHRQLEIIPQDVPVLTAATRMREQRVGSVFAETLDREQRECRIVGIITETDIIAKVTAKGRAATATTVRDIMSHPLLTIAPDRLMIDAGQLMERHHVRHLAVSDGNEIVGIISMRDLAKYFVEAPTGPVQALNDVYSPLTVLMQQALETVDARDTIESGARRMAEKRIGSVFVVEAGEIVGIVTETDVVRKAMGDQLDPATMPIGALVSSPLLDIDLNRSIRDACDVMAKHQVRHLAVRDQSRIVGVISLRDLVKMVAARDRPEFLHRTSADRPSGGSA